MAEATVNSTESRTESSSSLEEAEKPSTEGFTEDEVIQTIEEMDHNPDCPVCLQSCFYPVKLPCGHIFCFLCIKGVVLRSKRCALCRHSLSVDYLENPTLIKVVEEVHKDEKALKSKEKICDENDADEFVWYYEGRNGWWSYDEKTSPEVEKAFKSGQRSCTLLIAGFLYVIDFENMFQTRKNEPGRRRRIKRDKKDVERKGVAGIRIPATTRLNSSAPTQPLDSVATDKGVNTENQSESEPSSSHLATNDTIQISRESAEQARDTSNTDSVATRLEKASIN